MGGCGRRNKAGAAILEKTDERVTYTLDSTLDSVNTAELAAARIAAKAGFDGESCDRIAMAVREATVNAVLHGNAYDPKKKVTVSYENTRGRLTIRVADQGKGLDASNIPDPLKPENLLKTSGRGIFLMRAFMDEVNFRDLGPGTEITLVKQVSPAEGKEESK